MRVEDENQRQANVRDPHDLPPESSLAPTKNLPNLRINRLNEEKQIHRSADYRDDQRAGFRHELDLLRIGSGHLKAMLDIKETGHGTQTQRRIQKGCTAYRAEQRLCAQTGFCRPRRWAFNAEQMGEGIF